MEKTRNYRMPNNQSPDKGDIEGQGVNYDLSAYTSMKDTRRVNVDPIFRNLVYNNLQFLNAGSVTPDCLYKAVGMALQMYYEDRLRQSMKPEAKANE